MFKIKAEPVAHRDEKRIKLIFDWDAGATEKVKNIAGARWSMTMNCWHIPYTKEAFNNLKTLFPKIEYEQKEVMAIKKSITKSDHIFINNNLRNHLREFKRYLLQKRYSDSTIKTYSDALKSFFVFYNDKNVEEITNIDLIIFNNEYILKNKLSASYQNQIINAVKLFYEKQVKKEIAIENIERPRRARKLPKVIAKKDVEKMLTSITNLKHKIALTLIYACGLRRSELINLKLEDLNSRRHSLIVRNGKGQKDRTLPISEKLLNLIIKYYKMYKPQTYLVEGQHKGEPYGATSLEKIFHMNLRKVLKNHNFTLHCLRHSYATHLLEAGGNSEQSRPPISQQTVPPKLNVPLKIFLCCFS